MQNKQNLHILKCAKYLPIEIVLLQKGQIFIQNKNSKSHTIYLIAGAELQNAS